MRPFSTGKTVYSDARRAAPWWSNHHFKSDDGLWYGLATVRLLSIALLVVAACGGSGQIETLNLSWRGVDDTPHPSAMVAQSFAAAPLAFGLRDVRPDPTAVGQVEETGWVVHTKDNVATFCMTKVGEILARAGARMNETPLAILETELLEYRVVEGGTFTGSVRLRAIVRRGGGGDAWSQVYEGKSKRWGKSGNPDNYNEALSNALEDAASQMLNDAGFAHALVGDVAGAPPPPAPPGT